MNKPSPVIQLLYYVITKTLPIIKQIKLINKKNLLKQY